MNNEQIEWADGGTIQCQKIDGGVMCIQPGIKADGSVVFRDPFSGKCQDCGETVLWSEHYVCSRCGVLLCKNCRSIVCPSPPTEAGTIVLAGTVCSKCKDDESVL